MILLHPGRFYWNNSVECYHRYILYIFSEIECKLLQIFLTNTSDPQIVITIDYLTIKDDDVPDQKEEGEATPIVEEIVELETTEDEEVVTKQNMKSTLENMIEQEAKMAFDKIEEI